MTRNPPALASPVPLGGWHAALTLDYRREGARTIVRHRHEGPLRVLKALHPEGDAICHHVVVHPPGGIVGGDALGIEVTVGRDAHALVTTPGATRFYRSDGALASQRVTINLEPHSRFEWLPLETIVHAGANASNAVRVRLAREASMIGWDVVCLGLPASSKPGFMAGRLALRLEIEGAWLERATIDARDARMLDSPLGLGGNAVFATAWLALSERGASSTGACALDAARALVADASASALRGAASTIRVGVTRLAPRLVVARVLGPGVEPVMACLCTLRAAWRRVAWGLEAAAPRVWMS